MVSYNGWDSCQVRTNHSLVSSLGALKVTLVFKHRLLGYGPESQIVEGIELDNVSNSRGMKNIGARHFVKGGIS
ncbi:hypothetical protein JOC76_005076 [Neobacillus cucumis]|nr:hypothetical protein [Neobacillus cucumis]